MAIGGNEDKCGDAALLASFVELAGGTDARIVIVPAASVEPELRAAEYTSIFKRFGAACVLTVHAQRDDITRDQLMLITNATGIFVTGGDQDALMAHLRRTGCADAIIDAVDSGAVYAGTSAGAAVVSKTMIAGSDDDQIHFGHGLGLVSDVIIDQHFTERARLPRLIVAAKHHGLTGVGIDEDTAMIFDRGRTSVAGAGAVTIIDHEHGDLQLRVLRARSARAITHQSSQRLR
jgi:cyanophycinase